MYSTPQGIYKQRRRAPWVVVDNQPQAVDVPSDWDFAFCILFTNQAGTVILSFMGITLMIVSMLFNWYAPNNATVYTVIVQNILFHVYIFIMLAGYILGFVSAYTEVGMFGRMAAFLIALGSLLYIIFSICSWLTNSMIMIYVCPGMRCPDHHWFQDALWRGYVFHTEDIEVLKLIEKEIRYIESKLNPPYGAHFRDELSNGDNTTYNYIVLQSVLGKGESIKGYWRNNITAKITDKRLIGSRMKSLKYSNITSRPLGANLGYYIRVLSPNDEGSTLLMMVSAFFTIFILAFFLYTVVTFFAYGMQLRAKE